MNKYQRQRVNRLLRISGVHIMLKDLPRDCYFKRIINGKPTKTIYLKGEYIRSDKKYECCKADDANDFVYLDPKTEIFIDFIY